MVHHNFGVMKSRFKTNKTDERVAWISVKLFNQIRETISKVICSWLVRPDPAMYFLGGAAYV